MQRLNVPEKASRVLQIIGIAFLLIGIRLWYLTVLSHDQHVELALRPQRRKVLDLPFRASIQDRHGNPLALNRNSYQASILYDQIREIPSVQWKRISWNRKEKQFLRRAYVESLSKMLGEELSLDPQHVEDVIYSHASLFPNTPFILKGGISEKSYFRLKALEKHWPGIHMQCLSKRYYPMGKSGCDVIGYMGAIQSGQYHMIAKEQQLLKDFLSMREENRAPLLPKGYESVEAVVSRLNELEEKAYTLNAYVGKGGAEKSFDEKLRGRLGHHFYQVDMKGRILRSLEGGKTSKNGESLTLAISLPLQEHAEKLLSYSASIREKHFSSAGKDHNTIPSPWMKKGAIVALNPISGEILALASYPRFDPNDFIEKSPNVYKWLEAPSYLGEIWDGKRFLEREFYSFKKADYFLEKQLLTWECYLGFILAQNSPIKKALLEIDSLKEAILLQNERIELFETDIENALFYDLLHLLVDPNLFDETLLAEAESITPSLYRSLSQAKATLLLELKPFAREIFTENLFKKWREEHFKEYLKEKRKIEKAEKRVNRPYLDYLRSKEKELFKAYWEEHSLEFLHQLILRDLPGFSTQFPAYLESLRSLPSFKLIATMKGFEELQEPLDYRYRHLKEKNQKALALAFAPHAFGYMTSETMSQATPQGSIFKLITAFEAMRQSGMTNPLTLIDDYRRGSGKSRSEILGYTLDGKAIKRRYKGGTLPRSRPGIGKVDLINALECSSNLYFSLLASDILKNPLDLIHASKEFGFGAKTGIELPGEYAGLLPRDIRDNRTGLYSFAIGQHSLVVTPLQTAMMLGALVNQGELLKPQIQKKPKEIVKKIEISPEISRALIKGMSLVVNGKSGSARQSRIRTLYEYPPFLCHYREIQKQLIGKTSTAEINYRPTLDPYIKPIKAKHIWFGGVSFEEDELTTPELVVIVYEEFGNYGKEAAPYAVEMVKKWREINRE
ncbi:MAG: penicillin-binding transpeptidase domain-containing protein [Simkaniaceae bacterium]